MRILKLIVEGFTCYRQPTEIDFSDLDLFAITGPTGSGKSSLVDAIIFALYGRVPRLNLEVANLISQKINRANVLLEFQVANQHYKIARSVQVQKGSQAMLDIWDQSDWRGVAVGVRQVNAQLLQILGLDYEAFTRCIVLPQGEFQNFLHDSKSRQDILTRLLNLEILGNMQKDAFQTHEKTKERIQAIQQRLGQEFTGANAGNLQELRQQYHLAQDEIAHLQQQVELHLQKYKSEQEIWDLVQSIETTKAQYQALLPATPQMEALEKKIALIRKIQPIRAQLDQYQILEQRLAKLQEKQQAILARQSQWQSQIAAHAPVWDTAWQEYQRLPELEARLEQLQEARQILGKILELQQDQRQKNAKLEEQRQRIQELQKRQQEASQKRQQNQQQTAALEHLVAELQQAKAQLQKFQDAEPLLIDLREKYVECQRKAQALKQAKGIKEDRQQNAAKITTELQSQLDRVQALHVELQQAGDRADLERRWQQTEEVKQIQERIQYHIQQQQEAQTRWQQADQLLQQTNQQIQSSRQSLVQSQAQLQSLQHTCEEQQQRIQQITAELPAYQNSQTQVQTLQTQINLCQTKLQQARQEIQSQQRLIQQSQQERQSLLDQYQQHKQAWMKSYTEEVKKNLREGLQIGCDCPLCGQKIVQMPAVTSQETKGLQEIQIAIDREQQRIKALDRCITESETKLQNNQVISDQLTQELQQSQDNLLQAQAVLNQIILRLKTCCPDGKPGETLSKLQEQYKQTSQQIKQLDNVIHQIQAQIREQTVLLEEVSKRKVEYENALQTQKQHEQEYRSKLPDWIAHTPLEKMRQQIQQELNKIQTIVQKQAEADKIAMELKVKKELADKQVGEAEAQERVCQGEMEQATLVYEQKQAEARKQVQLQVIAIGQSLSEGLKQYKAKHAEWEQAQNERNQLFQQLNQTELIFAKQETALQELSQICAVGEKEVAAIGDQIQNLSQKVQQQTSGQSVEIMFLQTKQQRQDIEKNYRLAQERKLELEQTSKTLNQELLLIQENQHSNQEEYKQLHSQLQDMATQLQVNSFQELLATRTDLDQVPIWEQKVMQHRIQMRELENRLQTQQQKLDNRTASAESLKAIQQAVEQNKLQIRQHSEDCGRLQQKIEQTEKAMLQISELQVELTQLQKSEGIQKQLAWDLRANCFPSFVMERALQTLAEDASEQLDMLSESRYAFSVSNRDISVIDRWNQDEIRPAKTLSGGETFLASLALALALSDRIYQLGQHSGGAATLESLFLDEGFGSLDEEYLDVVVKALVNLQGTGRMIGIISHLPVLNNYLPARLVVHKTREGSTVEKVKN